MGWNQKRLALIELLADVTDTRPKAEKSIAAGYSEKEVFRAQRKPEFREAVLKKMRENLGLGLPAIYARLYKIAQHGTDRDAIRAADSLLKAAGEIAGTMSQIVNVQQNADDDARARKERKEWLENHIRELFPDEIIRFDGGS